MEGLKVRVVAACGPGAYEVPSRSVGRFRFLLFDSGGLKHLGLEFRQRYEGELSKCTSKRQSALLAEDLGRA